MAKEHADNDGLPDSRWFGSATTYEAAGRVGALPHELRPITEGLRIVGRAYTVRCPLGDNLAIHRAIAAAPAAAVIVVDANAHPAGYWGEVLTVAAQARGLAGLVIDGGVRDVDRLRELRWPVWSRSVSIVGCDKKLPGEFQQELTLGNTVVRPGDLVVGDSDGVVVVAAARVREVLRAAGDRERSEELMFERLRAGELTLDLLGLR